MKTEIGNIGGMEKTIKEFYKILAAEYPLGEEPEIAMANLKEINLNITLNVKWLMQISNLIDSTLPTYSLDTEEEQQKRLAGQVSTCVSNFITMGIMYVNNNF